MSGTLLRDGASSTAAMRAVLGDDAILRNALRFEAALAAAEAEAGLLPEPIAARIAATCEAIRIDPAALAVEAAHAGTLAIPLVARLRAALADDPTVARAVHRGATSQDLADTVLAMQVRDAMALLLPDLDRIGVALASLARAHADTPCVGRTLLQDALPIGLGLRIAHWAAGIRSATRRLRADGTLPLQFGGAAGTRAGLEGQGARIAASLARRLSLPDGPPWHGRRDRVAALGAALAILIGALGKMARDVSLLMQNAVAELSEPAVAGRGGSSAMAHKRNPTGCQVVLSAAARAPSLAATLLATLPQELERGLGGWQAEAPVVADLLLLASGAVGNMAAVAEGLEINRSAIARNLASLDGVSSDPGDSAALVETLLES